MTEIKIMRLTLENFKCHRFLQLDLNGGNASIYGDNAAGKTSIYDGLTWLLFGKDSRGNGEKNIEIKPLDANGEVKDHEALTAVEAVLDVSGDTVTLRRTYREVWATKRGSSTASYEGNTSEYYVNGVPCKKNAFQDQVNQLVSEDNFRLLTSVSHFAAGISWQERRAELFKVAGVLDDAQILASDERFQPLVASMGRLSLEDYKKKLLAEKRGFVGAKTEIPARISECKKTIDDIQGLDFAGAKAKVEELNGRKDSLNTQLLGLDNDGAQAEKRMQIREAQLELTALDNENQAYIRSQRGVTVDTDRLRFDLHNLKQRHSRTEQHIKNDESYISSCDFSITRSREQWISTNSDVFTGGTCVSCGQPLPADKLQKAKESFETRKKKRLAEIEGSASSFKEAKAQAEDRISRMQDEKAQLETEICKLEQKIREAEVAMGTAVQSMEGYDNHRALINSKIQQLSAELAEMVDSTMSYKTKLRQEMAAIQAQITEQNLITSKEGLLDYSRQRIESLRQDAQNAAECLEAIERMLFLMDEYSRYKTRFVEDSINGLFRIARFRLFREQANGGVEDRCDVVHDGIPYISVNNGMKINLGIDIINTLSAAYGVRVPLFVDNAESVTNLEKCGSQIVRLVVSENDKELRVNYEN